MSDRRNYPGRERQPAPDIDAHIMAVIAAAAEGRPLPEQAAARAELGPGQLAIIAKMSDEELGALARAVRVERIRRADAGA